MKNLNHHNATFSHWNLASVGFSAHPPWLLSLIQQRSPAVLRFGRDQTGNSSVSHDRLTTSVTYRMECGSQGLPSAEACVAFKKHSCDPEGKLIIL